MPAAREALPHAEALPPAEEARRAASAHRSVAKPHVGQPRGAAVRRRSSPATHASFTPRARTARPTAVAAGRGALGGACVSYSELTRTVPSSAVCTPEESSVAFFGAVDNRAHLYLMTVSLLSAHRFHPSSGYFILLPEGEDRRILSQSTHPFRSWSQGVVRTLHLDEQSAKLFGTDGSYSRYTFLRHAVPEMLAVRGYTWSINLDPDVITLHPWDLRVLLDVRLIAGRPVGRGSRTARWLQDRLNKQQQSTPGGSPSGGGFRSLGTFLAKTLNTTTQALERTPEINGGVLVFNNQGAVRAQWLSTCARRYSVLRRIVEGDQDLISLVLAANLSLPRYSLPTIYNYAFRRDRERLSPEASRRLRAGIYGDVAVAVHFVADGKPWQYQNLTAYPNWLVAARLWYVLQWNRLATSVEPSPLKVLSLEELQIFGNINEFQASQQFNGSLLGVTDTKTRLACHCYLEDLLNGRHKSDLFAVLVREAKAAGKQHHHISAGLANQSAIIVDQRRQLHAVCNDRMPQLLKKEMCQKLKYEAEKRARVPRVIANSTIDEQYPSFMKFLDDHKAVPVKSKYAGAEQCKLAHWYSRIKQDSTPPRKELVRKLGAATVDALIARVAKLPKLRKPPGSTIQSEKPCSNHAKTHSGKKRQRAIINSTDIAKLLRTEVKTADTLSASQ